MALRSHHGHGERYIGWLVLRCCPDDAREKPVYRARDEADARETGEVHADGS